MKDLDVIIAGAGTGGSSAAKAAANAGLKVCLLDAKKRMDIGKKICGDAIGRHHFKALGLRDPTSDEIESVMEGIRIFSPDRQTSYAVKGEKLYGYILNRYNFGQRLLKEAVNARVDLYDETQVLEPIIEKGFVRGITAKDRKTGKKVELRASLVVDATGFFATIRRKLKPELGIETSVDNKDVEVCYREIRRLKQHLDEPSLCQICLTQAITPGGYYWIFPEGEDKVNVGLGVAMTNGFPNPKEQLYKYITSQPLFAGSSVIDGGSWFVPTRRPLDSMVGNGIMIVGDAACQVNPIHGGGIGPSMIGGKLAAETAARAIEKNNVSREGLWEYNASYIRKYGSKQAGLEVFRILLQKMSDEDLNYGMHYKLITEEDLLRASMGESIHFTITEKARRMLKGLKKISLLKRLRSAANIMREVKNWYEHYPTSPEDFEEWRTGTKEIFEKANTKLTE